VIIHVREAKGSPQKKLVTQRNRKFNDISSADENK
jgi:hypothetical protein